MQARPLAAARAGSTEVSVAGTSAAGRLERARRSAAVAVERVAVVARLAGLDDPVAADRRARAVDRLIAPVVAGEGIRIHRAVPVDETPIRAPRLRGRHIDAGGYVHRVVPTEAVLLADVEERHLVRDEADGLDVGLGETQELARGAEAADGTER